MTSEANESVTQIDTDDLSLHVCPHCRGTLRAIRRWLECSGCGRRYNIRDNIPDFRHQMIHRSTLAEPGGRPFYLKATITDKDDATSEFNGTVEEYWVSPTKCHRVIKLRDFRRHEFSMAT